jgi:hypothetical protein
MEKYGFEVIERCLALTPITFCGKAGSRLDVALKVKTLKKSAVSGKTIGI